MFYNVKEKRTKSLCANFHYFFLLFSTAICFFRFLSLPENLPVSTADLHLRHIVSNWSVVQVCVYVCLCMRVCMHLSFLQPLCQMSGHHLCLGVAWSVLMLKSVLFTSVLPMLKQVLTYFMYVMVGLVFILCVCVCVVIHRAPGQESCV